MLYLLRSARRKKRFYNHISATEVVAAVGEDIWNSYFKFCIERNPWDKIVSAYYWKHSDEPRPTMTEFIESGYPAKMKQRGFGLYTIDGRIAVDHFVRFESLSDDMEVVRQRLGLPELLDLPHAKSSQRKTRRDYREYFSPAEAARLGDLFAEEIALLGYKFDRAEAA